MEGNDSYTVAEGNSFYEVDLSCVRRKQKETRENREANRREYRENREANRREYRENREANQRE